MAFISMVFVGIFIAVALIGLAILFIGIILDVICAVRKKKQKKVPKALKISGIVVTVLGALIFALPTGTVAYLMISSKIQEHAEIADFDGQHRVHLDSIYNLEDGFEFGGAFYVQVTDIHPQRSHENFKTEPVGAIIGKDDRHRLLYSVDNTLGITILTAEYANGVFVEENNVSKMLNYYETDAPLYCEVVPDPAYSSKKTVENINSSRVRQLRDLIETNGHTYSYGNSKFGQKDGYLYFYSTDDMCCIDFQYIQSDDGLILFYLGSYYVLDDSDSEFILSIANS